MVAVSVLNSSVLSGVSPRAADADAIASVARDAASNRAVSATIGGISVRSDRLQVAAASRYASEAATLVAVRSNAQYASSLAQTADDALLEIDEKLAQLGELAASAKQSEVSDAERIRLDLEFQSLIADINRIAATTHFDGNVILSGNGSGGAYALTLRVGSGTEESDEVTVSISAAGVADLSAGLAEGTLRTATAAEAAVDDVAAAREALGVRRGEVRGSVARIDSAADAAAQSSVIADNARRALIEPETAVDFSRLVAERVADEGDVNLFKDAEQSLRDLLIRFGTQTAAEQPAGSRETFAGKPEEVDRAPPTTAVDKAAPSLSVERIE